MKIFWPVHYSCDHFEIQVGPLGFGWCGRAYACALCSLFIAFQHRLSPDIWMANCVSARVWEVFEWRISSSLPCSQLGPLWTVVGRSSLTYWDVFAIWFWNAKDDGRRNWINVSGRFENKRWTMKEDAIKWAAFKRFLYFVSIQLKRSAEWLASKRPPAPKWSTSRLARKWIEFGWMNCSSKQLKHLLMCIAHSPIWIPKARQL